MAGANIRIARLLGLSTTAVAAFPFQSTKWLLPPQQLLLSPSRRPHAISRNFCAGGINRSTISTSKTQCRPFSILLQQNKRTTTRFYSETTTRSNNSSEGGNTMVTPIPRQARIISLSSASDPNNDPLHSDTLPDGAELLQIGETLSDFDLPMLQQAGVNTVFVSHPQAREPLAQLLQALPSIEWIHTRSAGIDFCHSNELVAWEGGIMTNAKGQFSSTLAEYTMAACSYFAKDFARLKRGQNDKKWDQYPVQELRGATLGIVGYGDIGRATAKLAKAYGMKVVGLRRHPDPDEFADEMLDSSTVSFNKLFAESDYILCAMPLTPATKGIIGTEQFAVAKEGSVFINVGRGPVVDEEALIAALKQESNRRLKGAGLDVFAVEPLPESSPLWELDNVLLSPHNMDMTKTFMYDSTKWFVTEQIPRFIRGEPLNNEVDRAAGY